MVKFHFNPINQLIQFPFYLLLIFSITFFNCKASVKNAGMAEEDIIVTAEGKKEMILLTDRPPNLETPLHYFKLDFTPNDVFFVRWHLAGMPSSVDKDEFRLTVSGHVNKSLSLSLDDLRKKFKPFSIVALAECAGNSRSFFDPKV